MQAPCHASMLMLVLSHSRWAKNICPGGGNMSIRGTLCPLSVSACSNYCSSTASHEFCAGIVWGGEIDWCKTKRRWSHSHAIIAGEIVRSKTQLCGKKKKVGLCCFMSLPCLFSSLLAWLERSPHLAYQLYWCLIITSTERNYTPKLTNTHMKWHERVALKSLVL